MIVQLQFAGISAPIEPFLFLFLQVKLEHHIDFLGNTSGVGQVGTDGAMLAAIQKKFPESWMRMNSKKKTCKWTEESRASLESQRGSAVEQEVESLV